MQAILFEHQHQQNVLSAVERAKQVTMTELNTIIGVSVHIRCTFARLCFTSSLRFIALSMKSDAEAAAVA